MALHIIIDGYNLIRQSDRLSELDSRDIQLGREALIDDLSRYRRVKAHQITVVFDGRGAPGFACRRDRLRGIQVRFSRDGESADTEIGRMAAAEREKALVVSSDRAVAQRAEACGSATIGSREFEMRMLLAAAPGQAEGDDEATGWVPTTRKRGPSRRPSKKLRRSRNKLEKL